MTFLNIRRTAEIIWSAGFGLTREAAFSQSNLDTYPSDGSVREEILKSVLTPEDPYNLRGRSSESYTNDRREDDVAMAEAMAEANGDIAPVGDMAVEEVTAEDEKSYIIDTYTVVGSGENDSICVSNVGFSVFCRNFLDYHIAYRRDIAIASAIATSSSRLSFV